MLRSQRVVIFVLLKFSERRKSIQDQGRPNGTSSFTIMNQFGQQQVLLKQYTSHIAVTTNGTDFLVLFVREPVFIGIPINMLVCV